MDKFRKKPVVIEAVRWTGINFNEMQAFMRDLKVVGDDKRIRIKTLEGTIYGQVGDWIIKGVEGEFYPCRDDIFNATYDPV